MLLSFSFSSSWKSYYYSLDLFSEKKTTIHPRKSILMQRHYTIEDNVLIGMGSIVMDDCVVESNSIIAAGAVVTKGTRVPSGSVFAGMPAKKIKDIDSELSSGEIDRIAENYVMCSSWFK